LNREIRAVLHTADQGARVYGEIVFPEDGKAVSLAESLLSSGYARYVDWSARLLPLKPPAALASASALKKAETAAQVRFCFCWLLLAAWSFMRVLALLLLLLHNAAGVQGYLTSNSCTITPYFMQLWIQSMPCGTTSTPCWFRCMCMWTCMCCIAHHALIMRSPFFDRMSYSTLSLIVTIITE
jgi:hypothetical protein